MYFLYISIHVYLPSSSTIVTVVVPSSICTFELVVDRVTRNTSSLSINVSCTVVIKMVSVVSPWLKVRSVVESTLKSPLLALTRVTVALCVKFDVKN